MIPAQKLRGFHASLSLRLNFPYAKPAVRRDKCKALGGDIRNRSGLSRIRGKLRYIGLPDLQKLSGKKCVGSGPRIQPPHIAFQLLCGHREIKPADFLTTKNDIFIAIKQVLDEARIEIPFNKLDVKVLQEA